MIEDYWLHTYFNDPKAVTETVEDDDFDVDNVAAELNGTGPRPPDQMPDDFEDLG